MNCPLDGSKLSHQNYEADIEIDKCSECGGMWLDYRELERIQESRERDYADEIKKLPDLVGKAYAMALAQSRPKVHCPSCNEAMERREHGGCSQVMVDVCTHCRGIWLDNSEVGALEVFFERARAETTKMRSGFFASLKNLFE
jgi:Zn-finger nucleic acid-binding protein